MERNGDSILLCTSAAWSPLYEVYQVIAEAYQVDFVMQSIDLGEGIYVKKSGSDHGNIMVEQLLRVALFI